MLQDQNKVASCCWFYVRCSWSRVAPRNTPTIIGEPPIKVESLQVLPHPDTQVLGISKPAGFGRFATLSAMSHDQKEVASCCIVRVRSLWSGGYYPSSYPGGPPIKVNSCGSCPTLIPRLRISEPAGSRKFNLTLRTGVLSGLPQVREQYTSGVIPSGDSQ
jgi:hypothetical protein